MQTTKSSILILAAGSSSRLGSAKQLLLYKKKTLLQHAIDEASASDAASVYVIVGANKEDVTSQIRSTSSIKIVEHKNWQEGMASSMQAGLSAMLTDNPELDSILIMLCDQPFVSTQLLNEMMQVKSSSGKGIVACFYKETFGVPVLFAASYFTQLFSLPASEGAKKIVMMNSSDVASVSFALGAVDIDTKQDYEQLLSK